MNIAALGATAGMILLGALVFLIGIVGAFLAIKRFYIVPEPDEAIVRTGSRSGDGVVSTGGGLWVIPVFHKYARVSLRAVRLSIDRVGDNAMPTADRIPAEIRGELLVQVDTADPKKVVAAVRSLGAMRPDEMPARIQHQVDQQVTDALRSAAFAKTFVELNAHKADFADEVRKALGEDLAKLGLSLTSVSVTHIQQGPFTSDPGDMLAAEGRRNVAETVEKNRQETNQITRNAQIAVQAQDVEAREKALALDLRQKQKEADQRRQVEEYEATQETEKVKAVLSQEQQREEADAEQKRQIEEARIRASENIEKANIEKSKALALAAAAANAEQAKAQATEKVAREEAAKIETEAKIAKEKAVEAARIAKEREIELAETEKAQSLKVADEARIQAIEEAEVARQVAVANKRAEEAAARAEQAKAEAEQRQAEEQVLTVRATAEADRQKKIVTIKAQEEAEKDRINADKSAYVQTKNAEGERDAALKRAEAVKARAEGEAEAAKAAAQGQAEAVKAEATGRADSRTIEANAYAQEKTTKAEADFAASEKEAAARIKLAMALLEEGKAEAESRRLIVEAENAVAKELLMREVAIKALEVAPAVLHEVMDPVAKASENVKILQVNGLNGENGGGGLPGTLLSTGLTVAGLMPFVKEAWNMAKDSDEAKALTTAVKEAAGDAAKSATEGLFPKGKSVPGPALPPSAK